MLDATHDAAARSWVAFADGHADFPMQNASWQIWQPALNTSIFFR
jgi:hypothetical protein